MLAQFTQTVRAAHRLPARPRPQAYGTAVTAPESVADWRQKKLGISRPWLGDKLQYYVCTCFATLLKLLLWKILGYRAGELSLRIRSQAFAGGVEVWLV